MTGVFILGLLAGLALLIVARGREHAIDVDAFVALDRLDVAGPFAVRPLFVASAFVSAAAALFGLPGLTPLGRAAAAISLAIVVWIVWLAAWIDLRWLLDASIVFQDHVRLEHRPALAFGRAPHAALSFRPVTAGLVLLAALAGTGVGFGVLARSFGWTRLLPALAATVWGAIGIGFVAYVRSALGAERRVRLVLGDPSAAPDEALFDALRRNPRSARLLVEHARRLEYGGEPLQALLEYRAAELTGSAPPGTGEAIARSRRRLDAKPGPIAGSIVRRRRMAEPRMEIEQLAMGADAVQVRVVDATRFLGELLRLTDESLIIAVQGEIERSLAEELRALEHLAPLIADDPARPQLRWTAWRMTPEVRRALEARIADGVPPAWVNVCVYTLEKLLVEARSHFALVLVAPDLVQREFIEWRRAAAVAPMTEDDGLIEGMQG